MKRAKYCKQKTLLQTVVSYIPHFIALLARVPRFYVGENIARSWASEVNWASRVEGWYTKEIAGVNEGMIDSYP